jgi:ribosomal protein S18 acetylase RimI-like enzyme
MPKIIDLKIEEISSESEIQVCAQMMHSTEPWISLKLTINDCLGLFREPVTEAYIASIEKEIIGFVVIQIQGAMTGYIRSICIKPEWRNKGVGKRLLQFAEEKIFSEKPNVFLCVSSFNQDAQRFYLNLGYEKVGEIKEYYIPGQSESIMRKSIGLITQFKKSEGNKK